MPPLLKALAASSSFDAFASAVFFASSTAICAWWWRASRMLRSASLTGSRISAASLWCSSPCRSMRDTEAHSASSTCKTTK